jgi:hypothetical protein
VYAISHAATALPLRRRYPEAGIWPILTAVQLVELACGVVCWRIYRGGIGLLIAIVVLNLVDRPLMAPRPGTGAQLAAHPFVLPTVILVQIVLSWVAVAWRARTRR